MLKIDVEKSIVYEGNQERLKCTFKKAEEGKDITIAYLGGSITQDSSASCHEKCYAKRSFDWWINTFPNAKMRYVNAGIGGTTSHFAAGRVDEDVLNYNPDLVFIEFSVNDEADDHFLETYEGLVRKVYSYKSLPAVILLLNVFYDSGRSARRVHLKVARHMNLPAVSFSPTYDELLKGSFEMEEVSADGLHPNDKGHELLALMVTNFLDKVYTDYKVDKTRTDKEKNICAKSDFIEIPESLTKNTYEKAYRILNKNYEAKGLDFHIDDSVQQGVRDCFKNGWELSKKSSYIEFEIECSGIAVCYRRRKDGHTPKALAYIDGKRSEGIILDGNFDETWGDKLELTTVCEHEEIGIRRLTIELISDDEDIYNSFYITSIIVAE